MSCSETVALGPVETAVGRLVAQCRLAVRTGGEMVVGDLGDRGAAERALLVLLRFSNGQIN